MTGARDLSQPDAADQERHRGGEDAHLDVGRGLGPGDAADQPQVLRLDRLVDEGLLEVGFRRLSGRTGPGAGRPSKLYRRSSRQLSVSLPERRYDLAGSLLATAIDTGWQMAGTERMTVNTNTLDHPRALGLYQKLGFVPVRRERLRRVLTRAREAEG